MVRTGFASLVLFLILRIQGRKLPRLGRVWKHFAFMGLFANAFPFILFAWGELHVDSALASILNGTTPLFTIVLAYFLISDDRMTLVKLAGTFLGFAGLLILVGPSLVGGIRAETLGLLAMVTAASSYAVTIIYSRQHLRGLPSLVAPMAQLLMAAIYLTPLSLLIDHPFALARPSWMALGALLALTLLGTAAGFALYYHVIEKMNATNLSMVTYLLPVFGVTLGVLVLGEQPGWNAYFGCALIILGVMAVNGVFRFRWRWLARFQGSDLGAGG